MTRQDLLLAFSKAVSSLHSTLLQLFPTARPVVHEKFEIENFKLSDSSFLYTRGA